MLQEGGIRDSQLHVARTTCTVIQYLLLLAACGLAEMYIGNTEETTENLVTDTFWEKIK